MKALALVILEVVSLWALVPLDGGHSSAFYWIALVTVIVCVLSVLLLYDRARAFTLLAGLLLLIDLLVASLMRGFDVLPLWTVLGMGVFSVILGVATSNLSRMVSGIVHIDRSQERIFMREILGTLGISLIAIFLVMLVSLAVLSLTFIADLGLSSPLVMAMLAILTMASLGTLVAIRNRV